MYYLMDDDGNFLFCFDRGYTSSSQEDAFQYKSEKGARKDLHYHSLSSKFKVVYIEEGK
jgi:hypothetical protein